MHDGVLKIEKKKEPKRGEKDRCRKAAEETGKRREKEKERDRGGGGEMGLRAGNINK